MTDILALLSTLDFQGLLNAFFMTLGGFVTFLGGLYAIALLVPGEQPDKAIKAILDFTQKISRK